MGDREPAEVADVLAQILSAVDLRARHRFVLAELRNEASGALLKLGARGRAPPVAHSAVSIRTAALVVEAVSEFVADHGCHGAEVHGWISAGVEIGWLQDPGRKVTELSAAI